MKLLAQMIQVGPRSLPAQGGLVQADAVFEMLGLTRPEAWEPYAQLHDFTSPKRDFGFGPEPTLSLPEVVRLAFNTQTTQARRWQRQAQGWLVRMLSGDVRLSAEIAERNPEPEARRWLHARLENQEARKTLMSTVARHGGSGPIYGQLGSISNRSVLGMNSASLRQERGVRATRDGLRTDELLRLSYLESATARAIEERGVQGNEPILALHRDLAERERQTWGGSVAGSAPQAG
ncbi:DNA damage response protein DdrC [Deinococcus sonorensis]|uniref:DNA damage response protein DdrC n=2 Tax=Deinococcus sonorensis TaxID=309891 RepID=A0AAU7U8C5_9DEIO